MRSFVKGWSNVEVSLERLSFRTSKLFSLWSTTRTNQIRSKRDELVIFSGNFTNRDSVLQTFSCFIFCTSHIFDGNFYDSCSRYFWCWNQRIIDIFPNKSIKLSFVHQVTTLILFFFLSFYQTDSVDRLSAGDNIGTEQTHENKKYSTRRGSFVIVVIFSSIVSDRLQLS